MFERISNKRYIRIPLSTINSAIMEFFLYFKALMTCTINRTNYK